LSDAVALQKRCPECSKEHLIYDYDLGEVVCSNCGYVICDDLADLGPEWRAFDLEQKEKRMRVGAPYTLTLHDKGLATVISWRDKDAHGKLLAPGQKTEVYRLRRWQKKMRVFSSMERNLAIALSELLKISSSLGIPKNVVEMASHIYRKVIKGKLIRGRSIQGIAAAALYAACRVLGIARMLHEIAEATHLPKKEVARSYRFILEQLGNQIEPPSAINYVLRFTDQLGLSRRTETISRRILELAKSLRLTGGRGPTGIAAAATYMASVLTNDRRTQGEIANLANVTEVTIRNRYKELLQVLNITVKL
jgi:transcription initiation factor TFIIB